MSDVIARLSATGVSAPGPASAAAGGQGGDAKSLEWATVMTGPVPSAATTAPVPATAAAEIRTPATLAPAVAPAMSASQSPKPEPRAINTAWVLPAMLLAMCLAATGWLFAHGAAATVWLIILLVVVVAGAPTALIALKLFGYEDPD